MNTTTHNASMPDIVFKRVGLRYGREREVLSDASFTLGRGSLCFVTGPSGSGKTSLLKLIDLSIRPSRGQISVLGQNPLSLPKNSFPLLKRRMGIVYQEFVLIEHLNVFENTALPLRIRGQKPSQYAKDVEGLLAWVGLGKRMHAYPSTLSGGEKQRAAIARAIIAKPELLIADEPTGNVDADIAKRLMRLFIELNRMGTTVIIATHDRRLVSEDAQILRLQNGQVLSEGGTI